MKALPCGQCQASFDEGMPPGISYGEDSQRRPL